MPRANNGIQLKRNKFGIYELRWSDKGRSKRSSTGTSDLGEAEKIRASFILLDERDKAVAAKGAGPMMVGDAIGDPDVPGLDYWTEHVAPVVVDKESIKYDRAKLLKHFGHLAVQDITPTDVQNYIRARGVGAGQWVTDDAGCRVCEGVGRPSVPATVRGELATLNAAIQHQVRARRLPKELAPYIPLPPKSEPRDVWLREEEADALLAAAAEPQNVAANDEAPQKLPRVYLFVAIGLFTAARKCGILSLKWRQIDFATDVVDFNPKGRNQTKKRRPKVKISSELRPILWRAWVEAGGPDAPEETLDKFVLGHAGSIRTSFNNAVKRAKIGKDVTPHVLRHTWATWAAQGGTDLWKIASVLDDTLETVERTYAHHHPDYQEDAVNNVRPSQRRRPALRVVEAA